MIPYLESQHKIADAMAKMESEVASVNQDMAYFRHVLDFQNLKIEKLTLLLIDLLQNKDVLQIVNLLQIIQTSDPFNVDGAHDSVDDSLPESVHDPVHDVTTGLPSLLSTNVVSMGPVGVTGVLLDSNMDPQLHQVAQAAVQAQVKSEIHQGKRMRKRPFSKVNDTANNSHNSANGNGNSMNMPGNIANNMPGMNHNNNISINGGNTGNSGRVMAERMSKHQQQLHQELQQAQNQQSNHHHQQQQQQQEQQQQRQRQQQQAQQQQQHEQQHHEQQQQQQLVQRSQQQQVQRQQIHSQQAHGQLQEHSASPQQQDPQQHDQQDPQQQDAKDGMSVVDMPGLEVVSMDNMSGRKKPKVTIDFLHNPMTVKEIYDEFTVGFRGQPPLREMDERYGKHEWRGDSRSKESKRFQRRKKLCDAIERGMQKFGKTAEEVQNFIEEFRGDKSLTWVMNGNLPEGLMEWNCDWVYGPSKKLGYWNCYVRWRLQLKRHIAIVSPKQIESGGKKRFVTKILKGWQANMCIKRRQKEWRHLYI